MVGAFQINAWVAAGAALGVIFSAAYALTLYRKVAFGVIENPKLDGITDLDARGWITFIPLVLATLIMGLAPSYVLDFTASSAETIAAAFNGAVR
jgi:NADH-quinone oxidoreductase subunit M